MLPAADLRHKRSLVKPERRRVDRSHPDYHYRQRSRDMPTYPSATGNDPLMDGEGEGETNSSQSMESKPKEPTYVDHGHINKPMERVPHRHRTKKKRRASRRIAKSAAAQERQRQKVMEQAPPPSFWQAYCAMVTFWAPDFILRCFGLPQKEQRSAWREKIGLISIILMIGAFVGFITFGFTAAACGTPPIRLKVDEVSTNYMIFHGTAYELSGSSHAAAVGIPAGSNVLYDLEHKYGGQDGSFFFQQVNGACKGLITPAEGSDIPTNADGDLAWYFPCTAFNPDGSTQPNLTTQYYMGWACHTSGDARRAFYNLKGSGDVYYTWEDTKNMSRNLAVYSGNVLDLDLLRWFNTSQVNPDPRFEEIRTNPDVRGVDLTYYFQTGQDKKFGSCLTQLVKVGSISTDTVGCIASDVVLYVALIFILSIVGVKFGFALLFQWFLARRLAAQKTSFGSDSKSRHQQIEDWSNDIYRPGPRFTDPTVPDRTNKRASFLPTTSRFSSPYTVSSGGKQRPQYVTMATQNSTTRLMPAGNSMYKQSQSGSGRSLSFQNGTASRTSLLPPVQEPRYSTVPEEPEDSEGSGPAGYIHEAVVPQPPPEWQPYGYPLAHGISLVTCYSEGEDGIRTTLDSIAMTDYPNSHKTILVICDGIIKGKGEEFSTPEIVLGMMKDHVVPPKEVESFSYVAVSTGSKRHNMAKVFAGFYDFGKNSIIPPEKQQRVPMMIIAKWGTPEEQTQAKPGNRGKRDSQIILMSFLQKVMFDERMTELEYEMFNGLWTVTGIPPDFYEVVLMVDADTKVFPDSLTHMTSAMVKDPEIMGLCGETKIANKTESWVTAIQVFEYVCRHPSSRLSN
jgi:chitin synthase